jgi:hypothetical protein
MNREWGGGWGERRKRMNREWTLMDANGGGEGRWMRIQESGFRGQNKS